MHLVVKIEEKVIGEIKMQLGITIPLQKYLKMKAPFYGEPIDLFFCWELHVIKYQGKNTLVVVNANNRFIVLLVGMKAVDWKELSTRVEEAIELGMLGEGYTKEQIDSYFNLAGDSVITKTHGRKPVAGLNKAIDYLNYIADPIDSDCLYQQIHCKIINRDICSPMGFEEYGYPVEFFRKDMERIGIIT